jgi:O-antigen/teichoic acid export membrane protein
VLLAINFIFVPKYGYWACAWGGFAGYGTCMVLSYFVGQKKAPIPYDLKSAFLYFAIAIALFFAQRYIKIDSTVWTLVINTGLLFIFFAFICWKEKDLVNSVMHVVNSKILKKK